MSEMEENEQTQENASTENPEKSAAEVVSANADGKKLNAITETKALIKIEGQEIELEAAYAQDDKMLKTILQPLFSSIENALITRDVQQGKLTVSIVKRAQHKGAIRNAF